MRDRIVGLASLCTLPFLQAQGKDASSRWAKCLCNINRVCCDFNGVFARRCAAHLRSVPLPNDEQVTAASLGEIAQGFVKCKGTASMAVKLNIDNIGGLVLEPKDTKDLKQPVTKPSSDREAFVQIMKGGLPLLGSEILDKNDLQNVIFRDFAVRVCEFSAEQSQLYFDMAFSAEDGSATWRLGNSHFAPMPHLGTRTHEGRNI